MDNQSEISGTTGLGFLSSSNYSGLFHEEFHGVSSTSRDDVNDNDLGGEQSRIELGAKVLAHLLQMDLFESLIEQWQDETHGLSVFDPWMKTLVASMKQNVHDKIPWDTVSVKSGRQQFVLLGLSETIFKHSRQPLIFDGSCTVDRFATLFTGQMLRWEGVGMFYIAVGLATMKRSLSSTSSGLKSETALANTMIDVAQTCITFCEEMGFLTDPELWIGFEHAILTSIVKGDASYVTWRRVGDIISGCFASGMHQQIEPSSEVPFWLSEMRKRLKASVYCMDKDLSILMSRPPRMSRRYCSMQLPLGLDLETLRLEGRELEEAVNSLDPAGWSTDKTPYRGLHWLRVSLIGNMIREDILELSLGSLPQGDLAFARQISERLEDAWLSFPEHTRQLNRSTGPGWFISFNTWMDFRFNEFLLQRVMVRRFKTSSQQLIDVSRELLSCLLDLIASKSRMGRFLSDLPWILAKFALPTAGILGLELLQQSQSWSRSGNFPVLPRSEVIQSISNLIAQLKTSVHKEDGNYVIVSKARTILQRILDQVLEPSSSLAVASQGSELFGSSNVDNNPCHDVLWHTYSRSELDFWCTLEEHPLLSSELRTRSAETS